MGLSSSAGFFASTREAGFLSGRSESCSVCNEWLLLCAADAPWRDIFLAEAVPFGKADNG
jgi:hypothetical protein